MAINLRADITAIAKREAAAKRRSARIVARHPLIQAARGAYRIYMVDPYFKGMRERQGRETRKFFA
jgi:hypothetical protein